MDNDSGDLSEDSTVLDSDDAEESDEIFSNNISIKKLSQTFIGKTREISLEMSGVEDDYSTMSIIYLGLANDDVYGIALHIFNDATYEDVYIQDGMAAIDMLFETALHRSLCMLKKKQYKTAKEYLKNLIENIENASDESK